MYFCIIHYEDIHVLSFLLYGICIHALYTNRYMCCIDIVYIVKVKFGSQKNEIKNDVKK